jgi:hypothetical protein
LLAECEKHPQLGFGSLMTAATLALKLGVSTAAASFMQRRLAVDLAAATIRLDVDLLPLADEQAFGPRRWDRTLTWPLEAPMIDAARFRMFREVKIESGLPER